MPVTIRKIGLVQQVLPVNGASSALAEMPMVVDWFTERRLLLH